MTKHRTQLFLEQHQYEHLSSIADAEGTSISAVVRRFVDQGLEQRTSQRQERLEWLHRAAELRRHLKERHGVYGRDPVAETRAEREEEMDTVLRQDGSA